MNECFISWAKRKREKEEKRNKKEKERVFVLFSFCHRLIQIDGAFARGDQTTSSGKIQGIDLYVYVLLLKLISLRVMNICPTQSYVPLCLKLMSFMIYEQHFIMCVLEEASMNHFDEIHDSPIL